jgi:hypothetical protein
LCFSLLQAKNIIPYLENKKNRPISNNLGLKVTIMLLLELQTGEAILYDQYSKGKEAPSLIFNLICNRFDVDGNFFSPIANLLHWTAYDMGRAVSSLSIRSIA